MKSYIAIFIFSFAVLACDREKSFNSSGEINNSKDSRSRIRPNDSDRNLKDKVPYRIDQLTRIVRNPGGLDEHVLWQNIEEIDVSAEERKILEFQLIEGLVADGRFEKAKQLILSSTGPGERRESLIFSLFTKYKEPLLGELQLISDNFKNEGEKRAALSGLARSLANPEGVARLKAYLSAGNKPDKQFAWALAAGLAASLDVGKIGMQFYIDPDLSPAVAKKNLPAAVKENEKILMQLVNSDPDSGSQFVRQYLMFTADIHPDLAWQALQRLEIQMNIEERRQATDKIIKEFIGRDGKEAIDAIVKSGEASDLTNAMDIWIGVDSSEAKEWFKENRGSLASSLSDATISSFGRLEANSGNLVEARELIEQISDPNLRKKAEGQIWAVERDALRREVGSNPSETVQGMMAGQSKYADYWIEEAMATWIQKEPAKAETWYNENWNSLSPAKSQYVAAAYANDALKKGDVVIAARWAALIQDQNTRQRLEASIAKANTSE